MGTEEVKKKAHTEYTGLTDSYTPMTPPPTSPPHLGSHLFFLPQLSVGSVIKGGGAVITGQTCCFDETLKNGVH